MSININGNKIGKFGKTLPTPYLDKVEIVDTKIKVFYSLYFEKPSEVEDTAFDDYLDTVLGKIRNVAIIMPKFSTNDEAPSFHEDASECAQSFITNNLFDVKQSLIDDSSKIYDLIKLCYKSKAYYTANGINIGGKYFIWSSQSVHLDTVGLQKQLALYSFKKENIFDENGNEVIRYLYQMNINVPNQNHSGRYSVIESVSNIPGIELCLFMFSTSLGLDRSTHANNNDPDKQTYEQIFDSSNSKTFKNIYTQQISDINYETIASEGNFKSSPTEVYRFTSTGAPYTTGDIMQSLNSFYYAVNDEVRLNILQNVNAVLETGADSPSSTNSVSNPVSRSEAISDKQLNSARDNIAYVLEVFGSTPKLLRKLNEAAAAFPTTSTATKVGRLHERLEIAIYNANNAVLNIGSQIVKQINLNTFVKDLRSSPIYGVDSERFGTSAYLNRIKFNALDEYIYESASKYGCYTDPNEYKYYSSAGEDSTLSYVANYTPNSGQAMKAEVTAADIKDYCNDLPSSTLQAARRQILSWAMDTNVWWDPGNASPESDYAKVLMYFGDPSKLYESYPVMCHMALLGGGFGVANNQAQYVDLNKYISGLSDKSDTTIMETGERKLYNGWYVDPHNLDRPEWTTKTQFAKNLTKAMEPLIGIVHNRLSLQMGNNFALSLVDEYTGVNDFMSICCAFYAINKYCEEFEYSLKSYNSYLAGYWWFDYEKALKERSLISFIYPVAKLEQLFDRRLLNQHFKLTETEIERYYYREVGASSVTLNTNYGPVMKMDGSEGPSIGHLIKVGSLKTVYNTTDFAGSTNQVLGGNDFNNDGDVIFNTESEFATAPRNIQLSVTQGNTDLEPVDDDPGMAIGNIGVDVMDNDDIEHTYSVLRNFKLLNDPESESLNYRLMCFEHQEVAGPFADDIIYDESEFPHSALVHSVTVKDNTAQLLYKIVKVFRDYLKGEFQDYYDSAIEQCSYNSNDDSFNQFFKVNAKNAYSETPNEAPWYKMPVLYHYHLDLLFNSHAGSREQIFAAAIVDSEKIAPDTGRFDLLLAFYDKVNNLFEEAYNGLASDNSVLRRIMIATPGGGTMEKFNDLETYPEVEISFNKDTNRLGTNYAFTDIPKPINLVNTLKYDDRSGWFGVDTTMPTTTNAAMDKFVYAIKNLTLYWNDSSAFVNNSAALFEEQIIDNGGNEQDFKDSIRLNARKIGALVWYTMTREGTFNEIKSLGTFGIETSAQIDKLLSYEYLMSVTVDGNYVGEAVSDASQVWSVRNDISGELMSDVYSRSSHPLWNTVDRMQDSELMANYFFDINYAMTAAIQLIAVMARSTYSFMTTGKNPGGFTVNDLRNFDIEVMYGSDTFQQTVVEYIDQEMQLFDVDAFRRPELDESTNMEQVQKSIGNDVLRNTEFFDNLADFSNGLPPR